VTARKQLGVARAGSARSGAQRGLSTVGTVGSTRGSRTAVSNVCSSTRSGSIGGQPAWWLLRWPSPKYRPTGQDTQTDSRPCPSLQYLPGHRLVRTVPQSSDAPQSIWCHVRTGQLLHRPLQSRRRDQRKKGLLAHLNRDRVTPVLAALPTLRFRRRFWFWLWLVLLCHAFNKACGEAGRPSGTGGLPQAHLRPPLRLTACHPSRLGLLL
jgi:hypothetical protein